MEKLHGIVIKSTGSWYRVLAENGKSYECRIKGKFRLEKSKSTNPIAVGDRVRFHVDEKVEYAVIDKIEKRKNFLVRKSVNLSKQTHVIAANIDYTILIVSLKKPVVSSAFIDRFSVISKAYEIEPVIVFNKTDIYNDAELERMAELKELYLSLGYKCFSISAKQKENIREVDELIRNKTSLFIGKSGVGKSTLLNCFNSDFDIKTQEVSQTTNKGQHSTTFYEMYQLKENTFIIDSPGIKELGLHDIEKWEVGLFFPEIKERASHCKFNTCLHLSEPKCAVLEAVQYGEISEERYINYLKILDDFDSA